MSPFSLDSTIPVLSSLPPEARDWLTALPWEQRRYVLSLCHLVCATPSAQQAEFLDAYTAEGLLSLIIDDSDTRQRINEHLIGFRSQAEIDSSTDQKIYPTGVHAFGARCPAAARSLPRNGCHAHG